MLKILPPDPFLILNILNSGTSMRRVVSHRFESLPIFFLKQAQVFTPGVHSRPGEAKETPGDVGSEGFGLVATQPLGFDLDVAFLPV